LFTHLRGGSGFLLSLLGRCNGDASLSLTFGNSGFVCFQLGQPNGEIVERGLMRAYRCLVRGLIAFQLRRISAGCVFVLFNSLFPERYALQ
jgi:hypothetical protein